MLVDLIQGGVDGEPGEADHIHADVEIVRSGSGGDALFGTDRDDQIYGADRILALDNVLANDTTDGGYSPMDLCTSDAGDSEP